MLLDNNTKKVIELIGMFDDLKKIDKIRLAIYLLENKNFLFGICLKILFISILHNSFSISEQFIK